MMSSVRRRRPGYGQAEIQISPLIDLMFSLLIFFLVTTTFVRETGLTVNRPQAQTATTVDRSSLMIGIGPAGEVFFEGNRVDLVSLRSLITRRSLYRPEISVVLVADKKTPAEWIVRVMDEVQISGIRKIAIASQKEGGR